MNKWSYIQYIVQLPRDLIFSWIGIYKSCYHFVRAILSNTILSGHLLSYLESIHFYSASHSVSLSEALPTTAIYTLSAFERWSARSKYKWRSFPTSSRGELSRTSYMTVANIIQVSCPLLNERMHTAVTYLWTTLFNSLMGHFIITVLGKLINLKSQSGCPLNGHPYTLWYTWTDIISLVINFRLQFQAMDGVNIWMNANLN